jgi:hypothetical protein
LQVTKTINHHFPDFYDDLLLITDPRKNKHYSTSEIIFAAISMFLFKCGSRNAYDNFINERSFKKNYKKLFGLRLPKLDAVANMLKQLPENELEDLKDKLVHTLIENRVFDKWRYLGKFMVAIDATGICSFKEKHCDKCLHKTYNKGKKNEKTVYYHNVLEAKLVTENGFSISMSTVWIENPGKEYDKQDCEQKAFVRMAEILKKRFPRLNICICADGLYPNDTFFGICQDKNWDYIVGLKEDSLKNFWKNIRLKNREYLPNSFTEGAVSIKQKIQWINDEAFNGRTHNWLKIEEQQKNSEGKTSQYKFAYLTSLQVDKQTVVKVCKHARLRWKIEKQGFDQQKNHGYNICHKYCRKSYTGMKNFYQCCQIAHMINQLVELSKKYKDCLTGKITTTHLWFCLMAYMLFGHIQKQTVKTILEHKTQIEYIKVKE